MSQRCGADGSTGQDKGMCNDTHVQESTVVEDPVFNPSDWHLVDVIPLHQIELPVVPLRSDGRDRRVQWLGSRLKDVIMAALRMQTSDSKGSSEIRTQAGMPMAVCLDLKIARPPWEVDDAEFMRMLIDACHDRLTEAR